jgi:hypothetical protein
VLGAAHARLICPNYDLTPDTFQRASERCERS